MKNRIKQGKVFRSLLAVLMLVAMLVTCMFQTVLAEDYTAGKKGSFTLILQETDENGNSTPIADVGLKLYKVGSVRFDGNVHFVTDSALESTGIDFDTVESADDWYNYAEILSTAVEKAGITGTEMTSDQQGNIVYSNLEEGMYLIVQSDPNGKVTVAPMLLSMPFVVEGQGWTYNVQAYPKASVSSSDTTTQISITKRMYYITDDLDVIELGADDATYKVGLFLNNDRSDLIPFRSDYMRDIHIQNSTSGTVTYSNVPDGTYYVFELDDEGNPLESGKEIEVEAGKNFYYNVTDANEDDTNAAVISGSGTPQAVSYVNNYYYYIPNGYYLNGKLEIEKKVLVDDQAANTDETFYAGIFEKDEEGDLVLLQNVELKQNDKVTVDIPFAENTQPEKVTYTVMETDKDGNFIDPDSFPYTVSGEGEVVLEKSKSYRESMTITNSRETEASPTPTPTAGPTVTPGSSTTPAPTVTPGTTITITPVPDNDTPGNNTPDTGGTASRSVRTGDNTPIAVWVGILAAAVIVVIVAVFMKRKKK